MIQLEHRQIFSQSMLWDLQRQYFQSTGIEAFRLNEVPHYITNNPFIANSYAEMAFSLLCDQQRLFPDAVFTTEPLYICEIGGGSGRFAYHFLRSLVRLCEQAQIPPASFRYVLTDFVESNLSFWRQHPRFKPFFESGILDIALYDMTHSDEIALERSGTLISTHSLQHPLIVIANYAFDGIPQELFHIKDGQVHDCLVTLQTTEDPTALNVSELLSKLHFRYELIEEPRAPYEYTSFQSIINDYLRQLSDQVFVLFPEIGLACMQRLKSFSRQGMLLLTADKGGYQLSSIQSKSPPLAVHHGSFSMNVNYHAFQAFVEYEGGISMFPAAPSDNITVSGLLLIDNPHLYTHTLRTYQREIHDFGPHDYYHIYTYCKNHTAILSLQEIFTFLRLSRDDSHLLSRLLPRLIELSAEFDERQVLSLIDIIDRAWEQYYPLGEPTNLANQVAGLLYAVNRYEEAIHYYEKSIAIYGPYTGTFFNIAVCYTQMGQHDRAKELLHTVIKHDPDNEQARQILSEYTA